MEKLKIRYVVGDNSIPPADNFNYDMELDFEREIMEKNINDFNGYNPNY